MPESHPIELEVIVIGDELLNGTIVDKNGAWLGEQTQRLGASVRWRQVVADHIDDIVSALALAANRSTLVVCSGGLGPTVDDMTAEAAAAFLGVETEVNAVALEQVKAWRAIAGRRLGAIDDKQAHLPVGAEVLHNPVGTAPGFAIHKDDTRIVFLPGVPREWQALCERYVLTDVAQRVDQSPVEATWKFFGYTESQLAILVGELNTEGLSLHYRAHFPEIHLRITTASAEQLSQFEDALMAVASKRLFARGDISFPAAVNAGLRKRGWTLAAAESCTGGLLSQMVTSVPGSSEVFNMGAVTYSDTAKSKLLGVDPALLAEHGAVSKPVVKAMAHGIRERAGSTLGIAISGIAGPGGGSPEKPVGTVHIAMATPEEIIHREHRFPWDRERVRVVSAYAALEQVRRACNGGLD